VSIRHDELSENCGDEGLLVKTDTSTGFIAMDFDAEELACWAEFGDLVLFQKPGLNCDCIFDSIFWKQHRDVVDIQAHKNPIAVEMEVGVGLGL
jgi:hypothetical protein